MANSISPDSPKPEGFLVHLAGHVLIFDRKESPGYDESTGMRLLLVAIGIEALRRLAIRWLYPDVPLWILIPLFLVGALLLVRFVAGLRLSQIGLYPWREWSPVEKSYFIQLLVLANVVFSFVFASRLRLILAQPSALSIIWNGFVPYLFFGFYQEVVYRGMVQSELVRRWGAFAGILTANFLYTFGPLHWNYFWSRSAVAVPMFAAIFAIGLFFGVLFRRSGNLWIVAVMHGIGNAYIVGSLAKH
ncbi:MAG: protease family protein [Verrucomicrobiota bacterium]|jgi:membrane protease YdiL (CAAX protease family)